MPALCGERCRAQAPSGMPHPRSYIAHLAHDVGTVPIERSTRPLQCVPADCSPLQRHGPLTHAPYQPRNPTGKVQTGSVPGGHEERESSSTWTGAQSIPSPHMSMSITALSAWAIGKSMLQLSKRCSVDQPDEPLFPGPAISTLADSDQKLMYDIVKLSDPLKPA
jgi:hypothetical protein